TRTPDGAGTIHLRSDGSPAQAWGPGRQWLLERAAGVCGELDDVAPFAPSPHPVVARLAHQFPRLRLPRTERVLDALVPAVLEQKVPGAEARGAVAGALAPRGRARPRAGAVVAPAATGATPRDAPVRLSPTGGRAA